MSQPRNHQEDCVSGLTRISEGLYSYTGTCRTYLLVKGDEAIVIDPGSGEWLSQLAEIGVKSIAWVLLTHTDRDAAFACRELAAAGARIAVPRTEHHLIADVESFWRRRRVFHNYNQVPDFLSVPTSAPVALVLEDFAEFAWKGITLTVEPTPGHSPGSVTLIGEVDGRKVAFVGDMIATPGTVPSIQNLQYHYGDAEGAGLLLYSCNYLVSLEPDLLLPSHGDPIDRPTEALTLLADRMRRFCDELHYGIYLVEPENEWIQVSDHVLASSSFVCSFYAVLSDDGHAVFIDYGYADSFFEVQNGFGYATRFIPHHIESLRDYHGVTEIDALLVTHYHDDHIAGAAYLQRRLGVPIWSLDHIAPILERPADFNVPCTLKTPLTVDRRIADRDYQEWRGIDFRFDYAPGQTDYHSTISFRVDGHHYLAIGDSARVRPNGFVHGAIIFANRVSGRNHKVVAARLIEIEPDMILHGHPRVPGGSEEIGLPFHEVTGDDLENYRQSAEDFASLMKEITPDDAERRCRADWVRFEPYRVDLRDSATAETTLVVENAEARPISVIVDLVVPEGLAAEPRTVSVELGPYEEHRFDLRLDHRSNKNRPPVDGSSAHAGSLTPATVGPSPLILCANVTLDAKPAGLVAECQAWFEGVAT